MMLSFRDDTCVVPHLLFMMYGFIMDITLTSH